MKKFFLTISFLFIISLGSVGQLLAQPDDYNAVVVNGNPPLTKALVAKTLVLLEWSLDIRLSNEQRDGVFQSMIGYWRANNRAEIESAVEVARLVDRLQALSAEQQEKLRETLRNEILDNLRQDTDDEISQMVLKVYDATHSPGSTKIPPGNNPSRTPARSGQRIGADGFSGIYVGLYNAPPGAAINSVEPQFVTFLPDGHVYWMLPPEGLLYFDPRDAARAYPDDWGTYEIRGSEIHVTLGSYNLRRVFVREGGKLKLQKYDGQNRAAETYTFSPLATGDGLRLDGTYRRYAEAPGITFAGNGSFRDAGFTRNFGTIGRADGTTYQDDGRGGAGAYIIEQNTLELRYSDGRVKRFAFTALPDMLARQPVPSFRLNYEILKLD